MKKDAVLEFDEAEGLFGGRSSTYSVLTALATSSTGSTGRNANLYRGSRSR